MFCMFSARILKNICLFLIGFMGFVTGTYVSVENIVMYFQGRWSWCTGALSWFIPKSIKLTFSCHFFFGNFFLTALINYRLINFSHSMLSLNFFFHWFVGCFNQLVSVLGSFWTIRQAECFVLFIIRNNSIRVGALRIAEFRIRKSLPDPYPLVKGADPHSSIIKQTHA